MTILLERLFKWLLVISTLVLLYAYFVKDDLPQPGYYDASLLAPPVQLPTSRPVFTSKVNGEEYVINPKFDYELSGVVVSYHDADSISDIYHHDQWKDFINLRDICVIWGSNVTSGVYKKMAFKNATWTCWASWPDRETGQQFSMNQLSNNHILSDNEAVNAVLMSAEPGDHIRLKGVLAEYSNPSSGFNRGTSTRRDDSGNGACETIYLDEFVILNKANAGVRAWYSFAWGVFLLSMIGFLVTFFITPVR